MCVLKQRLLVRTGVSARAVSNVEGYWQCSDGTVHYKYEETVIFAVLDMQLRRL